MKYLLLILALTFGTAHAGLIEGSFITDNHQWVSLTTDDGKKGKPVHNSAGSNWNETTSFSAELEDGVDYFLHIKVRDTGGIASLIGNLSLGEGHSFTDGTDYKVTDDTWQVSDTGWDDYFDATEHGSTTDDNPWSYAVPMDYSMIDQDAKWIWTDDAWNQNVAFFSIAIIANPPAGPVEVPEPGTIFLLAFGVLAILVLRTSTKHKC